MKRVLVAIGILGATAGVGVLLWCIIGSSVDKTVRGMSKLARSFTSAQLPLPGSVVVHHRDTVARTTSTVFVHDANASGLSALVFAASPTASWTFHAGDSTLHAAWHPTQGSQAPIVLHLLDSATAEQQGFGLRCGYVLVERAPHAIPVVVDVAACPRR